MRAKTIRAFGFIRAMPSASVVRVSTRVNVRRFSYPAGDTLNRTPCGGIYYKGHASSAERKRAESQTGAVDIGIVASLDGLAGEYCDYYIGAWTVNHHLTHY